MFLKSSLVLFCAKRGIKRWVAPTLRELRKRQEKVDTTIPDLRSNFIDWNYKSELFAYGKRLNENFDMDKLQQAFLHNSYAIKDEENKKKLGIFDSDSKINDNRKLIENGEFIMKSYITTFFTNSLPNTPSSGIKAIEEYLMSIDTLANISSYLGTKDLILSEEITQKTLSDTLKAVVGALAESSGNDRATLFVRDFICVQMNQKSIDDIWKITNPLQLLQFVCKQKELGDPEPRLIGEAGRNTILGVYNIGIYCNKKLIGNGFGENIDCAIESAAQDCLSELFDTKLCGKTFIFNK